MKKIIVSVLLLMFLCAGVNNIFAHPTDAKKTGTKSVEVTQCTICLEDNDISVSPVQALPCLHVFHLACIQKWLAQEDADSVCPLCKRPVDEDICGAVTARDPEAPLNTTEILCHAVRAGNYDFMVDVVEGRAGADPNAYDLVGLTAMHCAASRLDPNFLLYLIRNGGNADIRTSDGARATPAHFAASGNCLLALQCLVAVRADVTLVDSVGATPLHDAAAAGNIECVTFLAKLSKLGAKDVYKCTPYGVCSGKACRKAIADAGYRPTLLERFDALLAD